MADTMNRQSGNRNDSPNQTMQHEQAKASVQGGHGNSPSDHRSGSPQEHGDMNRGEREKSAIGGGDTRGEKSSDRERSQDSERERSETGEPGRARSELDSQR